jgi:hypothetical protein
MKKLRFCLLIITMMLLNPIIGQNIYPEKFDSCNTQRFTLESDSISAKKNKSDLIELITRNIDSEILKSIKGVLKVQIIAYKDLSSCFLSYENNTNATIEQLNISEMKNTIDNDLIWLKVAENAAALIEIKFRKSKITLKRYGMNGKKGFHELSD